MFDFYLETSDLLRAEGPFLSATEGCIYGETGSTIGLREGDAFSGICICGLPTAPT